MYYVLKRILVGEHTHARANVTKLENFKLEILNYTNVGTLTFIITRS